jgi:predicted DNA-binding transcriptional regulator AlpA
MKLASGSNYRHITLMPPQFLNAMRTPKHTAAMPPLCAAPIYRDTSSASADVPPTVHVAPGTTQAPVKFDDLPRDMRRRLGSNECTENPLSDKTMSANKTPILSASDRIIRLPELLAILQISRTVVYDLQKKKILPHSVSITGGRAVGWKLSDIDRYLASLSKEARDD